MRSILSGTLAVLAGLAVGCDREKPSAPAVTAVVSTVAIFTPSATPPSTQPITQPIAGPSTQPATQPALVAMFHGGPGHWCALCAAAAARKAEAAANGNTDPTATSSDLPRDGGDLMQDLPPR